jgi:hypothetical protein
MKIRLKITWILFYLFALLLLVLNGSFRLKHLTNFWLVFKDTIAKHSDKTVDKDWTLHYKHDKR